MNESAPTATAAVSELASEGTTRAATPSAIREPGSRGRIPSLDGMRAVSIVLVVAWHLRSSGSAPWLDPLWRIDTGNLGVRVFFVISGFLITSVLLAEYRRTGTIALRRFYIRRAFRIMPVFYVFLAVMAIAGAFGVVDAPLSSVLLAGAYTGDYTHLSWSVGHTWSLAVEEQFYLLWPGLIALFGLRRAFVGAMAMLLISPTVRTIALVGHWPNATRYAFEGVADALATGCLLAYSRSWLWDRPLYRRMLQSKTMYLCPVIIAAVAAANVRSELFGAIAGISLLNIMIAVFMDWCLRDPDTVIGRVLNARPIAFIGVLSYSIYLWQQPFLREHHSLAFPLNVACIGAFALTTYLLVEKPFLRLRARLEGSRT